NSIRSPEAYHQHYAPAKSLCLHEYVLIKHQSRRAYPVHPIAQCWLWTVLKRLRVTHQFPARQSAVPHRPELPTTSRNVVEPDAEMMIKLLGNTCGRTDQCRTFFRF